MATAKASRTAASPDNHPDDDVTANRAVVVHDCSRLGRTANPPTFSLIDWFRFGRRR